MGGEVSSGSQEQVNLLYLGDDLDERASTDTEALTASQIQHSSAPQLRGVKNDPGLSEKTSLEAFVKQRQFEREEKVRRHVTLEAQSHCFSSKLC